MAGNVKDDSSVTDTVEKSSPLTLDKLPVDVLERVIGWLSLEDCLVLRKVTRDLRSFVDSSKIHCEAVGFESGEDWRRIKLPSVELTYEKTEDGYELTSVINDTVQLRRFRDHQDFKQAPIVDAASFLGMAKLEIGQFTVDGTAVWPELLQLFKALKFPLNVRSIRSNDLKFLHSIQEFLNPEKLEEIVYDAFDRVDEFRVITFNELAKTNMDIVKNPKLKFETIVFDNYSDKSLAGFSKILNSINNQLRIQSAVVVDKRWISTILKCLNPENVEDVLIKELFEVGQFRKIARMVEWKTKTRLSWREPPRRIGLEQLVDFKEVQCYNFELTEENLIKIRDILLKSPYLRALQLTNICWLENIGDEIYERIERIMIEDPTYDVSTCRFSIPNSQDYFQLRVEECWRRIELIIKRISP